MPQGYSKDPYAILGLPTSASASQVKEAYRRLARQYHPDLNKDPRAAERMKDINWANGILNDPVERSNYDFWRRAASSAGPTPRPNPASPPPNGPRPMYTSWPVKRVQGSGWSLIFIFWAIMSLINNFVRSGQQVRYPTQSSEMNATLFSMLDSFPLTMTASANQTEIPNISDSATSTPSLVFIDIRAQIFPGTQEWEWINTLLKEYSLTTSTGLSDKVTRVLRNLLTGDITIETRQYGTFLLYVSSRQTPVPVHFPPTTTVLATPSPHPNDFPTTVSNPSHIDIRAKIVPGSQEWEWINTYLSDYHLTTPDGLSDEVIDVYYNQLTEEIVIMTRQYGVFGILIDPRLGGFSVVHHPPTPMP